MAHGTGARSASRLKPGGTERPMRRLTERRTVVTETMVMSLLRAAARQATEAMSRFPGDSDDAKERRASRRLSPGAAP
jgi:hypothetical protein